MPMHRQAEIVSREYLVDLLTPLIGQRDDRAARRSLHLTANITRLGRTRVDADIQDISAKGITDCFDGRFELLTWEDIREVQLILHDGLGNIQMEGSVLELEHEARRAAA
jgi:hypothetical protein